MNKEQETKTVTISKEQIDALFDGAQEQGDYVFGYFKMLYGTSWEQVDHIDGFAHAGRELTDYYTEKAIEWDKAHLDNGTLPGGAALNYGPSTDTTLDPWEATIPPAIWKEEKK